VLRFRLGSFPVSVYPSFLIAAALLGYVWMEGWQSLLIWIAVVFVSVLVHELGHAVVALTFGGRPEIRLEGFGGVTFPRLPQPPPAWKQVVLSVAGPVAGLGLGVAAWALGRIGTDAAREGLRHRLAHEQDTWVREEISMALGAPEAPAVSGA